MGTYLDYFGDQTIPEDKREEFTQRVLTILDQGGMMALEEVSIFGKRIWLMSPPHIETGKETVTFRYNYFENDIWESAGYDTASGRFCTNKVGWLQFNLVCSAVYVLCEFYTGTFGMANRNDHVYSARHIIGWLNHLFQERYDDRRACDLWRIYRLLPDNRRDDDLLPLLPSDASIDCIGMLTYLFVTRENHEKEWKQIIELFPHTPDTVSILDCIKLAEGALAEIDPSDKKAGAPMLEQLKTALKSGKRDLPSEFPRTAHIFAGIASLLPIEIIVKLISDAFSQDFFVLLEELSPYAQNVRSSWNFRDCQPAKPVPPVDTAAFLHCSDDDRAWWWRPDGDIIFSDEMNAWLSQCRSELETLARQEPALHGTEPLVLLIETLHEVQERHRFAFAFREMFYDFMVHLESPMVQAAIRFLRRLSEEEPESDVRLRRYLAVLGNLPLRRKIFEF